MSVKPTHAMSYLLRTGPPKPQADLSDDEGLTDVLVVHSIMGRAGGPGALSVMTMRLDADGFGDISDAEAFHLAVVLLAQIEGRHSAAAKALSILRQHVLDRRGG